MEAGFSILNGNNLQTVCDALTAFFDYTGRWDERIALDRLAEERAVEQGDFSKAGWRACQASEMHFRRKNAVDGLAAAERAMGHWQQAPEDPFQLGVIFRRRGMGYKLQKHYPKALALPFTLNIRW